MTAKTDLIPNGTRVIATNYKGEEVTGTVTSRAFFFEHILFYVVTEDANGRPYLEVPEHQIYPPRDAIRAA